MSPFEPKRATLFIPRLLLGLGVLDLLRMSWGVFTGSGV